MKKIEKMIESNVEMNIKEIKQIKERVGNFQPETLQQRLEEYFKKVIAKEMSKLDNSRKIEDDRETFLKT